MKVILFNPLSSKGKNEKVAKKLARKYTKQNYPIIIKNLLEIEDVNSFAKSLETDADIIICGGDGTLHKIINTIDLSNVTQNIYMYKGGSGNDFIKSLPKSRKLVKINQYIKEFPTLVTKEGTFKVINGAGLGIDGMVCSRVNESKRLKNRSNYAKNTIISFMKFPPMNLDCVIDGQHHSFKKVWLASGMYGDCFGGGMKIAKGKKRNNNQIQFIVVHKVPRWFLILIFPTIYFGWHKALKFTVKVFNCQSLSVSVSKPTTLQVDGETQSAITDYQMNI